MMQDECRELSKWLATRLDAMYLLRYVVYKELV